MTKQEIARLEKQIERCKAMKLKIDLILAKAKIVRQISGMKPTRK